MPEANPYLETLQSESATGAAPGNPYLDLLQSGERMRKTQTAAAVSLAVGTSPEEYAKRKRVAEFLGYPPAAVDAMPDLANKQAQEKQVQQDIAEHPVLQRRFSDEDFARLAHDDTGMLSVLANSVKRGWSGLQELVPGAAFRANSNALKNFDEVEAKLAAGEVVLDTQDPMGLRFMTPEQRQQQKALFIEKTAVAATKVAGLEAQKRTYPQPEVAQRVAQAQTFGGAVQEFLTDPVKYVASIGPESVVQSAPSLLLGGLAGRVGGMAAGAAAAGGGSFVTDYNGALLEALGRAGVDVTNAEALAAAASDQKLMQSVASQAFAHATMVGAFDAVSAGAASRVALPAGTLAARPMARELANLGVQIPVQGALGGAGELGGQVAAGQDIEPGAILAEIVGEGFGAPAEVTAMALGQVQQRMQQAKAEADMKALQEVLKQATESATRERAPESFAALMQEMADASPDAPKQVRFDARTLLETLQQSGLEQAELEQMLPSVMPQLDEAVAVGGEVVVPLGEFSKVAGTDLEQSLLQNARIGDNELSQAESKQAGEQAAALLQQQAEQVLRQAGDSAAARVEAETVRTAVLDQLNTAGRFRADVNEAYATLVRDFYVTMAGRLKTTPDALYAQYPLTVRAEGVGGFEQPAYHGSPHRGIEQFTTQKIGTGEGAQAYGWGLYFAQSKDIAEFYRKALTSQQAVRLQDANGKPFNPQGTGPDSLAAVFLGTARGNYANAAKDLVETYGADAASPFLAELDRFKAAGIRVNPESQGQLYEVEVPDDADMLDYDASLKDQPEKVRKALETLGFPLEVVEVVDVSGKKRGTYDTLQQAQRAIRANNWEAKPRSVPNTLTGKQVYEELQRRQGGSPEAASRALFAAGIPGLRYLDASSRGPQADKQSRNYVIFDDSAVKKTGELYQSARDQTETPEFKAWFGDSKVVDENGKPLVVYHGTGADFDTFQAGRGADVGFHFGDAEAANYVMERERMQRADAQLNALPVLLSIRNPLRVEDTNFSPFQFARALAEQMESGRAQGIAAKELLALSDGFDALRGKPDAAREAAKQTIAFLQGKGFDGLVYKNKKEGRADSWVAFRPEQIKSAIGNRGTFDANDPSILAQGPRGTFNPAALNITLLQDADLSTFLHETGHFFLDMLWRFASDPQAPADVQADMAAVLTWFKATPEQWGAWTDEYAATGKVPAGMRKQHERFAEGFEQYLLEGKAPSIELQPLFSKFRSWLLNVYKSLKDFLAGRGEVAGPAGALGQAGRDQTETPEFKAWFGDSKVVDENGKPLVVYHGTNATFDIFSIEKIKSFNEGVGLYFTNNPTVAGSYGKLMQVYLSLQKPLAYDAPPFKPAVVQKVLKRAAEIESVRNEMGIEDGFLSNYGDVRSDGLPRVLRDAAAQLAREDSANDQIAGLFNGGLPFDVLAKAVRDVTGYDGFVAKGFSNEGSSDNAIYVAWFPEQIKSAIGNRGTFDPNDPSILNQANQKTPLGLTDEVRGVFDRLLASQEQIAQAEMLRGFGPLTVPGMQPAERAAYEAQGQKATDTALDKLASRSVKDMRWTTNARSRALKALQQDAAAKRKVVEAEVAAEVAQQPIRQAMRWLRKGEMVTAEGEQIRAEKGFRLSTSALAEMYPGAEDTARIIAATRPISDEEAMRLVEGKTEKPGGVDPAKMLNAGIGNGRSYRVGNVPLDLFVANEDGERYDGTVDPARAKDYAERLALDVPPVIASQSFRNATDGKLRIRDGGHRISAARLRGDKTIPALVSVRAMPDLARLKGMTAGNGLHPDVVAGMFGFSSGDELVRALIDAEPTASVVEGMTDQRMLERFGDLATEHGMQRAADEAVHNEARGRFIATGLKALQDAQGEREQTPRGGSVNVMVRAAKSFASQLIARRKVRDLKPGQHTAAEARAGKAAMAAAAKNDTQAAIVAQRDALLNHYAARETYAALDEVDRALVYLRKFAKDSVRKGLPAEYLDQIDKLLERVDLRTSTTLGQIDKRAKLADWIKAQADMGVEVELPAEVLEDARLTSYKDLPLETFRGLVDTVKQVEHLGRLKDKLLTARDERAFAAVQESIVASILANGKGRVADTRTPRTNLGRAWASVRKFGAAHVKVATWARIMDGGKDGPVWEYFVRSANERGDQETTMLAKATQDLSAIMAPLIARGRLGGAGQFFSSIRQSLNREAVLAIALNIGNESNLQRLLGGEGWTPEQIQPVLDTLTPDDWAAVQKVWDYFETFRPLIGAKELRVRGKAPDWIEPGSTLADRYKVKGGYYPVKYDPAASQRAEEHADAEGARRQLQGAYGAATTRRSFTKARAEEVVGRPLLYTLQGVYSGVTDVIHDLAWHEWLIDVNRLLRSKGIDSAIRETYGPDAVRQFKAWRDDIAEGNVASDRAMDMALGYLRQSVSVAGLGFNVVSAMMQPLGLAQSIQRVGLPWIARGIRQTVGRPVAASREVNAKSSFMTNRARTRFRELNELRNRVQGQNPVQRVISENAFRLMVAFQRLVDVPTWMGAYEKAIAEGNDEARAVALADQAVIDAQGGGQVKDLAAIERGPQALKLFTVFYSFMNTALNLGVASAMTPRSRGKLAADMLLLFVLPAVLGSALKDALTPGDAGDDDEELAKKLAGEQLSYLLGLVVLGREFGQAARMVTGADAHDYTGPAGLRAVADVYQFTKQASQGEFDDAFRKATVNLAGDFLGLPSAQINRSITGAQALSEGKTQNPAALLTGYQEPR